MSDRREEAARVADAWITRHATPDRIVLTQGAMVNLTTVIAAALDSAYAAGIGIKEIPR